MDQSNMLSIRTRHPVESRKFTHTKSCHKCREPTGTISHGTLDTTVPISSICGIQFVGVASPLKSVNFIDLIEQCQVKVTRNPKDGIESYGRLVESFEEISSHADRFWHFLGGC